jgi:peptidoglycan/LPS O-acetylase OafA/YrhL
MSEGAGATSPRRAPTDAPSESPTLPPRLGYQPGLEGLRGIAILTVVVAHLSEFVAPSTKDWLLRGGFLGVDVFFVLSGFLITALLLGELERRGRIDHLHFYARRAARLLPALALFLAVHLVYTLIIGDPARFAFRTDLYALSFVTNYQLASGWSFTPFDLRHLWTLAVEAQFYLFWPLLLPLLRRAGRRTAGLVGLLVGAVCVVVIIRYVEYRSWGFASVYTRTEAQIDSLLLGAVVAALWSRGLLPRRGLAVIAGCSAAALAACMVFARPSSSFLFTGGFTLVALASAGLMVADLGGESRTHRALSVAPLRLAGRVSYSVYLWHLPVDIWVLRHFNSWPELSRVVLALAMTAALGGASYYLVERPVLRRPRLRR